MDKVVLICLRVADLKKPTPGSIRRCCHRCGAPVWVSAATVATIVREHIRFDGVAELRCDYDACIEDLPDELILATITRGPSPEQRREMQRELRGDPTVN